MHIDIYLSSASNCAHNTQFPNSLLLPVPIIHQLWLVLQITSSLCKNTGMSISSRPFENAVYEFVLSLLHVPRSLVRLTRVV